METADIKQNLSTRLDSTIIEELVDTYIACYKAYRRGIKDDWKSCLNEAGQFCEATIAAIHQLTTVSNQNPSGDILNLNRLRFNIALKGLPQVSHKSAEQEALLILMPRIAQAIYSLRSKKRATHLKKTKLNFFDANFTIQGCTWILCEFIRMCHTGDEQVIQACIKALSKREPPFIDVIDGDIVILAREFPVIDQILLLLLFSYEEKMKESEVIKSLAHLKHVKPRISDGNRDGLLHRKDGYLHLTSLGAARIEEKLDAHPK